MVTFEVLQAIGVDNETLISVSSLFDSAGDSLAEAHSQRNYAFGFANAAHTFYLKTTFQDYVNAGNAASSAIQSEFSAAASNSAAIETRGYATEAIFLAGISQQAGLDYATALAQADGFAANAATATSGAIDAAAIASHFSQAAVQFADAIGTTQANISRDHAIEARKEAIIQRNSAVASRDAAFRARDEALAAADSARSMGERVFFNNTAQKAAETVALADQARMFADQAIQAAMNAQTDAANALNVANGNPSQSTSPGS